MQVVRTYSLEQPTKPWGRGMDHGRHTATHGDVCQGAPAYGCMMMMTCTVFQGDLFLLVHQVLTRANKKRMEELKRQEALAKRMGAGGDDAGLPSKFVLQV